MYACSHRRCGACGSDRRTGSSPIPAPPSRLHVHVGNVEQHRGSRFRPGQWLAGIGEYAESSRQPERHFQLQRIKQRQRLDHRRRFARTAERPRPRRYRSERAQDTRSAVAATCVVFGNTDVVCDPNAKINYEELTLLRFLGANFVDPGQIDAKQHWKVGESNGAYSISADYTIAKNVDGALTISEDRIVRPTKAETSTIDATIGYDFKRQIPITITEYAIERSEVGEQYVTIKTETVLSLQTDSMTPKT